MMGPHCSVRSPQIPDKDNIITATLARKLEAPALSESRNPRRLATFREGRGCLVVQSCVLEADIVGSDNIRPEQ